MSLWRIRAVTVRIIRQFRRDPRTLGLLFVVPVVILSLLGYIYRGSDDVLMIGISGNPDSPVTQTTYELIERQARVHPETHV